MGMHFGLFATKTSTEQLRLSFPDIWPDLEVKSYANNFNDVNAVLAWKASQERFVPASKWSKENPSSEVYLICQDGPWAILMDFSYVLASDEEALKRLSSKFGVVVSFVVETTGGTASFWHYASGELTRMINWVDGNLETSGSPVPEEHGIVKKTYYMDETERLMHAFGLSRIETLPAISTTTAIATIDRADYSELVAKLNKRATSDIDTSTKAKRSWWKFW